MPSVRYASTCGKSGKKDKGKSDKVGVTVVKEFADLMTREKVKEETARLERRSGDAMTKMTTTVTTTVMRRSQMELLTTVTSKMEL